MSVPSLRVQAARGAMVVTTLKVVGTLIERISQLILPLYLLPSDFGLFALALFFSGFLGVVGELGMTTFLVRVSERFDETADTAFALRLVISLALLGLAAGLGFVASKLYPGPSLALPIFVLSLGLMFQAFAMVPRVLALRDLDYVRAAVPDGVGKFAGAGVTIALAIIGFAYWSPVYGALVGLALGSILQVIVSRWRPRVRINRALAGGIVRYGQFVSMAILASFLAHSVDNAIVGWVLGIATLGYYVVAYSWGVYFVSSLSSVLGSITYPLFARVVDARDRMKRVFRENLRYYTYLATCLSAGMFVVAPLFVLSLYGDSWEPAIAPMQILAPVGLLLGYTSICADALYAAGRSKRVFAVSWLEVVVLVVLLPAATYFGGIVGTSLAALGGAVVLSSMMGRDASQVAGLVWVDWIEVVRSPLLASASGAAVTFPLTQIVPHNLTGLAVAVFAFAGTYVAVLEVLTQRRFLAEIRGLLRLAFS